MGATRRLTAVDAAWLRMEERGNAVDVTAVLVFDGALPEDGLRALLEQRLLAHERFRERVRDARLGVGFPRWEPEPAFSLDAHVVRETLPAPGGRRELQALVTRWMDRPFDWSRSPWRIAVVDGCRGGTALVAQLHHCMGDGFALVDVLLSLADGRHEAPRPARVSRRARWMERGARLREAPRVSRELARDLARLLALSFDTPSPLRGALSGRRAAAWAEPIPLAAVKAIAHARRCTVNDLLTSVVAGALRRYLAERGVGVDELAIRAVVPMNLRPPGLPVDLEHGNWFALVYVDLPLALAAPDARLAAVRATLERIKHSREPLVALGLLHVIGRTPRKLAQLVLHAFARKSSIVVTNVPGPRERLSFAGVPLREIVFWVPHPAQLGVGISILSYAGEVRVGARSDLAVVPDPERIVALFADELRSLEHGEGATATLPS